MSRWLITSKYIFAGLNEKRPYLIKQLKGNDFFRNKSDEELQQIITDCNKADPTGDRAVYTQWIIKQYINDNFKGEEDIDKFRDILSKLIKLTKSKRMSQSDINQYQTYGDLVSSINDVLKNLGGYTSKGEEGRIKTEEGIKHIDSEGNFDLYIVNTPEAAAKYFRHTQWCVKDPSYFDNYAKRGGKDFYFITKNKEPFMLVHPEDQRDVYDNDPSKDQIKEILPLILKNDFLTRHLSEELLSYQLIDKNSKQYNDILSKVIEDRDSAFNLLRNKTITKEDGDIFYKALNKAIEDTWNAYMLLDYKTITKEDGDIFYKALNKAFEYSEYSEYLLRDKIITKEDEDIIDKLIEEDSEYAFKLLTYIITREDGELFYKVLNKVVEVPWYDRVLLKYKKITKEDGNIFYKVLNRAIEEDSKYADELLRDKIITKEDIDKARSISAGIKLNRWFYR